MPPVEQDAYKLKQCQLMPKFSWLPSLVKFYLMYGEKCYGNNEKCITIAVEFCTSNPIEYPLM